MSALQSLKDFSHLLLVGERCLNLNARKNRLSATLSRAQVNARKLETYVSTLKRENTRLAQLAEHNCRSLELFLYAFECDQKCIIKNL